MHINYTCSDVLPSVGAAVDETTHIQQTSVQRNTVHCNNISTNVLLLGLCFCCLFEQDFGQACGEPRAYPENWVQGKNRPSVHYRALHRPQGNLKPSIHLQAVYWEVGGKSYGLGWNRVFIWDIIQFHIFSICWKLHWQLANKMPCIKKLLDWLKLPRLRFWVCFLFLFFGAVMVISPEQEQMAYKIKLEYSPWQSTLRKTDLHVRSQCSKYGAICIEFRFFWLIIGDSSQSLRSIVTHYQVSHVGSVTVMPKF